MSARLGTLKKVLRQHKLEALLVTKEVNISYLTEHPSADSWLLVTKDKTICFTDARYTSELRKSLRNVVVHEYMRSLVADLLIVAQKLGLRQIGIDERQISHALYQSLIKQAKGVKFVSADGFVEDLRAIKDKNELQNVRKALAHHNLALQYLKRIIKPGCSEREIFKKLENFVRDRDVTFSFPSIIASGPNSSYPHAHITDRRFKTNDLVLVDIGIEVKGYKSDLTRIFFLGKIPELVFRINHEVAISQQRAIAKIKAGIKTAEIDQEARNYLKSRNLDQYFSHSLGHGVGLEIHEQPRLSVKDPTTLREGMIITVEPGVYFPHKFGIRLEEMVYVKKNGCEVLSGNIN